MKSKNFLLRFFTQIQDFRKKWRDSSNTSHQLDILLNQAQAKKNYAQCTQWLIELTHWIRKKDRQQAQASKETPEIESTEPTIDHRRLRYLFFVLNRHPQLKTECARILRTVMRECDGISLLCDAGMSMHSGFLGALVERFNNLIIPRSPNQKELSALVSLMFPDESDIDWIETIPSDLILQLHELFNFNAPQEEQQIAAFSQQLLHALHNLICQISSTGLSHIVRSRITQDQAFETSPFYQLSHAMIQLENDEDHAHLPSKQRQQKAAFLHECLENCQSNILSILRHLYSHGVSVDIVFQVTRMKTRIERAKVLLNAWVLSHDLQMLQQLAVTLVNANQNSQSIRHLLTSNLALLSRRLVETNANTGEHYIARDRADFFKMFQLAAGGGMITVGTVIIKFWIVGAHTPAFIEGVFAGLNYALSFLIMHFLHFTLATKQPAMTAPTIAREIDQTHTQAGLEKFVDSVMALFRTQVAAICGNVFAVFPLCLALQLGTHQLLGSNFISAHTAHKTLQAFSLTGPTPFWAMITGVILWSSSVITGWADNWFTLNRVDDAITYNRRLNFTLGELNTHKFAQFCKNNVAGVVGNVGLGLLLGLMPALLKAISFAFEVRHVTLSAGAIGIVIGVLGFQTMNTPAFWWAIAGLISMAFFNVVVSFLLGLTMAIRSRSLKHQKVKRLVYAIFQRIIHHPKQLIWPAKITMTSTDDADKSH